MPITFELKSTPNLPLDVRNLNPDLICNLSIGEILKIEIGFGNRNSPVSQWFDVSGDAKTGEVIFNGPLDSVHAIGHSMQSGKIEVQNSAGRHLGAAMSGGEIIVRGDVDDFAGYEMQGGTIVIHGNAGDHLGGCFPGAGYGMNRGTILVAGSAGKGLGYRMQRGTIVVASDVGEHAAWQMRAGTVIVFGNCAGSPGIDMKRGTIFAGRVESVSESFAESTNSLQSVFDLLKRWLESVTERYGIELPFPEAGVGGRCWAGDVLTGMRGELVELYSLHPNPLPRKREQQDAKSE